MSDRPAFRRLLLALGCLAVAVAAIACGDDEADGAPLRLGFLMDYTGDLAEWGPAIEAGVRLAVEHANAAGGVLGQPVEVVLGDTRLDIGTGVAEARRLIDDEGAHAIIGPIDDAIAIAIAREVAAPVGIPVISPASTSPLFSKADDDGFLFRTTLSDVGQGEVLAGLARDQGFANVGVLYVDNPYGQGMAEVFEGAFAGESRAVAFAYGQTSYLPQLREAASRGAQALVAIAYPRQARVFVREAIESGLFQQFLFVDGTKSPELIAAIGAERLEGMRGTAPTGGPETPSTRAWDAAWIAEHGALPSLPFVREGYDAAIALMLAAEAAGSTDGRDIRDRLTDVAGPDGEVVIAGADGVARALALVRDGVGVNYEGAGSSVDWNADGDVVRGWVGIWEYRDGGIVEIGEQPFALP